VPLCNTGWWGCAGAEGNGQRSPIRGCNPQFQITHVAAPAAFASTPERALLARHRLARQFDEPA